MKFPYAPFDNFIFRIPFFPISIKDYFNENAFSEAIFLASPDLFKEMMGDKTNILSQDKINRSAYKYLSRASTRCTPFGFFVSK